MEMLVAVMSGFGLAVAAPWLERLARQATGWLIALLPIGLFAYFVLQSPRVVAGVAPSFSCDWVAALGVRLSLQLDGLALLFALLITGVGALIFIYAGSYMADDPRRGRFFSFLLLFMASMLGVALADNLLLLYVFWELTSISSWLLIGFNSDKKESRAAAWQALLVTSGGGLALLGGLVLMGQAAGTFELSELLRRSDALRGSSLYAPILVLILLGAFTKSAQFPFHFWLPNAMAAPTPVSAYLHSATMVKAGVYLLARLSPALAGTEAWGTTVTLIGAITFVIGGYLTLQSVDLKRLLAYSTISALGTMVSLLGLGTRLAAAAAMTFLLAHAAYKGALFLLAGIVDHATGTRRIDQLGGLWRAMPVTAGIAAMTVVSLAGAWPVFSFIAKEQVYEAIWTLEGPRIALLGATVLTAALLVAAALVFYMQPFTGPPKPTPEHPHEAPVALLLGPAVLMAIGWVIGVWPGPLAHYVLGPAAGAVLGHPYEMKLALWHGWNPMLALSIASTVLGVAIYFLRSPVQRVHARLASLGNWGPAGWYDLAMSGLVKTADLQTRLLQNGYLRYYFITILAFLAGLAMYAASRGHWPAVRLHTAPIRLHEAGIALLILVSTVVAIRSRSRLGAVAALGGVGYGVALIFALYGAPDLAMTQFLIETLFVVLFVLVFYHLPRYTMFSKPRARVRDAVIAVSVGSLATVLLLTLQAIPLDQTVSDYYIRTSAVEAHGRNVVNVILVDFRGLDTLGEITVLGIAAIGVFALLKLRPNKREGR